jgi:dipeptidyl aminopeptidase/acylaminoacyl peptidase
VDRRQRLIFIVGLVACLALAAASVVIIWRPSPMRDSFVGPGMPQAFTAAYPLIVSTSPDGRRVLLKTRHADDFSLEVLRLADGKRRVVDRRPETQLSLSWSPDGQQLAMQAPREDDGDGAGDGRPTRYGLHAVPVESGQASPLPWPATTCTSPPLRWSPDGSELAVELCPADDARNVFVGRPNETPTALTALAGVVADLQDYAWLPTGRRLVVLLTAPSARLVVVDVAADRIVETVALPEDQEPRELVVAPSGDAAVFTSLLPGAEFRALRRAALTAGGGGARTLVANPGWDVLRPAWLAGVGILWHADVGGRDALYLTRDGAAEHELLTPSGEAFELMGLDEPRQMLLALARDARGPARLVALSPQTASSPALVLDPGSLTGARPTPALRLEPVVMGSGATISSGWLWAPVKESRPTRLVISVHGGPYLQARPYWDPGMQYLVEHRIAVLDLNYPGSSGKGVSQRGAPMATQVEAIAAAVREAEATWGVARRQIVLYGHSYGGRLVAQALDAVPDVGGAVLASPVGLDGGAAMPAAWPRRSAVLYGLRDALVHAAGIDAWLARPRSGAPPIVTALAREGHYAQRTRSWVAIYDAVIDMFD